MQTAYSTSTGSLVLLMALASCAKTTRNNIEAGNGTAGAAGAETTIDGAGGTIVGAGGGNGVGGSVSNTTTGGGSSSTGTAEGSGGEASSTAGTSKGGTETGGAAGETSVPEFCTAPSECGNEDPVHCECVEQSGACVLLAKDVDDDGHGDELCLQDTTADDCNDALETVYPGAEEVCDGVDNNCNGKEDIDEGFTIGNTSAPLGSGLVFDQAAAWSPELNLRAVYYNGEVDGFPEQRLFTISPDGLVSGENTIGTSSTTRSSLAAGHDGWGHVYVSGDEVSFQRRNAAGDAVGGAQVLSAAGTYPTVLATEAGWIAAWVNTAPATDTVVMRRLDLNGAPLGVLDVVVGEVSGRGGPSMTLAQNEVVVVHGAPDNGLHLGKFTLELLRIGDDVPLNLSGESPMIVANGETELFGLAWQDTYLTSAFVELGSDGQLLCDAVELSNYASGDISDLFGAALVPRGAGFLAVAISDGRRVTLSRIGAGCAIAPLRHLIDDSTGTTKGRLEIHGGMDGYVTVWREPNAVHAAYRYFGDGLCN